MPWFFLSYAHLDSDGYLKKFHKDLSAAVRRLKGLMDSEIGFLDTAGIETGERWTDKLVGALQTSRVLVALYSPTYFLKEYCGKEWQIFQWRLDAYAAKTGNNPPPLIIPVLWVQRNRLSEVVPKAVSEIQYTHGAFGDVYAEEGLRQIMALNRYRDEYKTFIEKLANRLIDATINYDLPPINNLPPLGEIPNVFQQSIHPQEIDSAGPQKENVGPRYAQFIFVVGRRDELKGIRDCVDSYGVEGGLDWVPYLPDVRKEIAILAQDLAVEMDLRYESVPLDGELVKRLRLAEQKNKIVVMIADTWTLRLQRYHTVMREYDSQNFLNTIVLISWNPKDAETMTNKLSLETAIHITFPYRMAVKDPNTFLDSVTSHIQFKRELGVALNKARMRIVDRAEVVKKAESEKVIAKPVIVGPGRTGD